MTEFTYTIESLIINIRDILLYRIYSFNGFTITVGTILAIPLILLLIRLFFKFYSQF